MPDGDSKKLKRSPGDSPWYVLATLDSHSEDWNRVRWNRYIFSQLDQKDREAVIQSGRHPAEELAPFTPEELHNLENTFRERRSAETDTLPQLKRDPIDFSNVIFNETASFEGFIFPAQDLIQESEPYLFFGVSFAGAQFLGQVQFAEATFYGRADFFGASGDANFDGAAFFAEAVFERAAFASGSFNDASFKAANFDEATFSWMAEFQAATFAQWAYFRKVRFAERVTFERANFIEGAEFEGAVFCTSAEFESVRFKGGAFFVNAQMKGETSFASAAFESEPPEFFGATLHEGTNWHGTKWPPPPEGVTEAIDFVRAYERLKLEMDRLKKHEDELDFFAREMQCRQVVYGTWKVVWWKEFGRGAFPGYSVEARRELSELSRRTGRSLFPRTRKTIFGRTITLPSFSRLVIVWPAAGLAIAIYGLLCDYGRNYIRPLTWLLGTMIVGALFNAPHFRTLGFNKAIGHAIGLSVANTLGVLGFRKDFVDPAILKTLPDLLIFVAGLQTVFGAALLFLFVLALRNRFRMR